MDKRWEGAPNWEIDTDLDKMLNIPDSPDAAKTGYRDLEQGEEGGAPVGANSAVGVEPWKG